MPDSTKLFHPQLSTFLRNSTSVQLQNWLNLYGPAIIDSIATRQSESVLNTRPLTKYFKTTSATSTRPRTRHRRTLKPRFNSKVHAPKNTKSKRRLPPVRYTARITIPHGLLDGFLQTKSSHSFLLSKSSNLNNRHGQTRKHPRTTMFSPNHPGFRPSCSSSKVCLTSHLLCYDP
jgi:hypothetical protein